jgi:hypothetical protein
MTFSNCVLTLCHCDLIVRARKGPPLRRQSHARYLPPLLVPFEPFAFDELALLEEPVAFDELAMLEGGAPEAFPCVPGGKLGQTNHIEGNSIHFKSWQSCRLSLKNLLSICLQSLSIHVNINVV